MKTRTYMLPGSRTEFSLGGTFTREKAVQLLRSLQDDQGARDKADKQPDQVLKGIGVTIKGGAKKVKAGDLIGGLRPRDDDDSTPVAPAFIIIIIIIIILVSIPISAS